jgi:hypothetical protein
MATLVLIAVAAWGSWANRTSRLPELELPGDELPA